MQLNLDLQKGPLMTGLAVQGAAIIVACHQNCFRCGGRLWDRSMPTRKITEDVLVRKYGGWAEPAKPVRGEEACQVS